MRKTWKEYGKRRGRETGDWIELSCSAKGYAVDYCLTAC
jgi:hypothetical protein